MWIGIYVTGRFHDQFEIQCKLDQLIEVDVMTEFEVICGYEQMIQDAVLTKFEVNSDSKRCEWMLS
jgi:hypothetical protein